MGPDTLAFSIILSISAALQSIVGFGLALSGVPLLLAWGVPLISAVFSVMTVSFVCGLFSLYQLKRDVPWSLSGKASAWRLLGIVPGLAIAKTTSRWDPAAIQAVAGTVVGLGVMIQAWKLWKQRGKAPRAEGTPPSNTWAPSAFLSSGVLMGWLGMGGPPLILWLMTGRQSAKTSRAFLFGIYVLTIPAQLLITLWGAPEAATSYLPPLLKAIPLTLLITFLGLRWGNKLSTDGLQKLSLLFLGILALKSMAAYLPY